MENEDNNQTQPITPVQFFVNSKIKLFMSPIDGRGVVAVSDIQQNEVIERCPLIPLSNRSRYQLEPMIWKYCYPKPICPCNECKNHGFLFYMVAGNGMMYNHQDEHNAEISFNFNELYADLIAKTPIKSGEEIFVNYGPEYFKNLPKKSIKDVLQQ